MTEASTQVSTSSRAASELRTLSKPLHPLTTARKNSLVPKPRLNPSYEALSYRWGPDEAYKEISINSNKFPVRRNLWWALYHLRKTLFWKRVLWIDGICIDQQNVSERGSQVMIMGLIYSLATRVLVWLGEEVIGPFSSDAAMKAFARIAARRTPRRAEMRILHPLPRIYTRSLYQREYWERLWIVQEVCVAWRIEICCGPSSISWEAFCQTSEALQRLPCSEGQVTSNQGREMYARNVTGIMDLRSLWQESGLSIFEAVQAIDRFKCEKTHDRIYGILGLVTRPTEPFTGAHYSKTLGQLYFDVMRWVLAHDWRQNPDRPEFPEEHDVLGFSVALQSALKFPFGRGTAVQTVCGDISSLYPVAFGNSDYITAVGPLMAAQNFKREPKPGRPRLPPVSYYRQEVDFFGNPSFVDLDRTNMNNIPWELKNIIEDAFLRNARGRVDLAPEGRYDGVEMEPGARIWDSFLFRICETYEGNKLICHPNVKLGDVVALRLDRRTYKIPSVLFRSGSKGSYMVGQAQGDMELGRLWWPNTTPVGKYSDL
jgi:hypothetical protein